jgi:hypothetical protein
LNKWNIVKNMTMVSIGCSLPLAPMIPDVMWNR